jgi:hypothetical protein
VPAEATAPHPLAENLLEEIAEARAAKLEFGILTALSPPAKALAAGKSSAAGRRAEFRAGFPVGAEFVVFFPLDRVGEDLVGLVDFLEFLLGALFVLGDIGMKFAGELAEGLLDFVILRSARDAEGFVIIFVLDGHRQARLKAKG